MLTIYMMVCVSVKKERERETFGKLCHRKFENASFLYSLIDIF